MSLRPARSARYSSTSSTPEKEKRKRPSSARERSELPRFSHLEVLPPEPRSASACSVRNVDLASNSLSHTEPQNSRPKPSDLNTSFPSTKYKYRVSKRLELSESITSRPLQKSNKDDLVKDILANVTAQVAALRNNPRTFLSGSQRPSSSSNSDSILSTHFSNTLLELSEQSSSSRGNEIITERSLPAANLDVLPLSTRSVKSQDSFTWQGVRRVGGHKLSGLESDVFLTDLVSARSEASSVLSGRPGSVTSVYSAVDSVADDQNENDETFISPDSPLGLFPEEFLLNDDDLSPTVPLLPSVQSQLSSLQLSHSDLVRVESARGKLSPQNTPKEAETQVTALNEVPDTLPDEPHLDVPESDRSTMIQELSDYLENLKHRHTEEGEPLVHFPENFDTLVATMPRYMLDSTFVNKYLTGLDENGDEVDPKLLDAMRSMYLLDEKLKSVTDRSEIVSLAVFGRKTWQQKRTKEQEPPFKAKHRSSARQEKRNSAPPVQTDPLDVSEHHTRNLQLGADARYYTLSSHEENRVERLLAESDNFLVDSSIMMPDGQGYTFTSTELERLSNIDSLLASISEGDDTIHRISSDSLFDLHEPPTEGTSRPPLVPSHATIKHTASFLENHGILDRDEKRAPKDYLLEQKEERLIRHKEQDVERRLAKLREIEIEETTASTQEQVIDPDTIQNLLEQCRVSSQNQVPYGPKPTRADIDRLVRDLRFGMLAKTV
eukprot:TRINITY_DN7723_c0_g1::TRINITY_DN7723_c0_g1_i1::g.8225::m.8225 TRINITY_DN7723_c0_g1::TRINITY_DN7723_c0_g1_i1::g.8225  ORF type:complete len:722 (+),score=2.22,Plexin_cytopl/PF08337.7/0.077,DUF2360/PF10152.4/5.2e+03,DUF2360/PF10152.4/4e+03,DUF2360/PF10152.4/0.046 TRINITY_DN7723_c0_g1_i1:186-2351(+)